MLKRLLVMTCILGVHLYADTQGIENEPFDETYPEIYFEDQRTEDNRFDDELMEDYEAGRIPIERKTINPKDTC